MTYLIHVSVLFASLMPKKDLWQKGGINLSSAGMIESL